MSEQLSRCLQHGCEFFVFDLQYDDQSIIDKICPVCWLEEHLGAAVYDVILEEDKELSIVFGDFVLHIGRLHGIDKENRHFEFFDQEALFDTLTSSYLEMARYYACDDESTAVIRVDFASMDAVRNTAWALIDITNVEYQIEACILDDIVPD